MPYGIIEGLVARISRSRYADGTVHADERKITRKKKTRRRIAKASRRRNRR